jgi:hypothetical protein
LRVYPLVIVNDVIEEGMGAFDAVDGAVTANLLAAIGPAILAPQKRGVA